MGQHGRAALRVARRLPLTLAYQRGGRIHIAMRTSTILVVASVVAWSGLAVASYIRNVIRGRRLRASIRIPCPACGALNWSIGHVEGFEGWPRHFEYWSVKCLSCGNVVAVALDGKPLPPFMQSRHGGRDAPGDSGRPTPDPMTVDPGRSRWSPGGLVILGLFVCAILVYMMLASYFFRSVWLWVGGLCAMYVAIAWLCVRTDRG